MTRHEVECLMVRQAPIFGSNIAKAKALGKGYTSILAKIIEKALDNPALTEQLIK